MRRNGSRRTVRQMDNEIIKAKDSYEEYDNEITSIARCASCGELIFEDNKDVYINNDGEYFCGMQCVLDFYEIRLSED